MSVLFGITFVALIGMIYLHYRTPDPWEYPIHLVLQSAEAKTAPDFNDDEKTLVAALNTVPTDPNTKNQRAYNTKYDARPFPELSPRETWGPNSEDTDYGVHDGAKPSAHVTQQVSFKTVKDLQEFLVKISTRSAPAVSPAPAP